MTSTCLFFSLELQMLRPDTLLATGQCKNGSLMPHKTIAKLYELEYTPLSQIGRHYRPPLG